MTPDELIQRGELSAAIDALGSILRHDPRDSVARASLFTLLCFAGQWDRAGQQLDTFEALVDPRSASVLDPARYRPILEGERARQRYFAGGSPPLALIDDDLAANVTLSISRLVAAGEHSKARDLLEQFEERHRILGGRLGGELFDNFRDAEDWMAPVLEVLAPEGYFWVGWDQVQFLDVVRPSSLLDLIWAPARLGLRSGVIGSVVLPGLYSTSWSHPDAFVKLGRRNEWIDIRSGLFRGAGAKVYYVGDDNKSLVELQDLVFDAPSAADQKQPAEVVT